MRILLKAANAKGNTRWDSDCLWKAFMSVLGQRMIHDRLSKYSNEFTLIAARQGIVHFSTVDIYSCQFISSVQCQTSFGQMNESFTTGSVQGTWLIFTTLEPIAVTLYKLLNSEQLNNWRLKLLIGDLKVKRKISRIQSYGSVIRNEPHSSTWL